MVNNSNWSPIYWASRYGHLEVVQELLRSGTDPNVVDSRGRTPLYQATDKGHLDVVQELLSKGADFNKDSRSSSTGQSALVLYRAIHNGYLDIVNLLENYTPSLHTLALTSINKYRIDVSNIPTMMVY